MVTGNETARQKLFELMAQHGVRQESLEVKVNLKNDRSVLQAINDCSRLRGVLRDFLALLSLNLLLLLLGCSTATSPILSSQQDKKLAGTAANGSRPVRLQGGQGIVTLDPMGGTAGRGGIPTFEPGAAGQPAVDHDATVASTDAEVDGGVVDGSVLPEDAGIKDAGSDAHVLAAACEPCVNNTSCATGLWCVSIPLMQGKRACSPNGNGFPSGVCPGL